MIEGANESKVFFDDDYEIASGATSASGPMSMEAVIADLEERRNKVLEGGINCIPLPFKRFSAELPGIEQEQYVVLTAGTKCGKTQLGSFIYLYSVLDYAFEHPDQCTVHIIYFALEESEKRIKQRYISHLLYRLYGIRISPSDLRSTSKDFPVPEEIIEKIKSSEMMERLKFFDDCIQFETEDTNPTGILRVCEEYAKSVGEYKSYKRKSRGKTGQEVEVFQSYTPKDKNHYKIVFIDHVGLVDLERGMTLKQSMDKVSEYAVKYLRNRYLYTVVVIQQQAMESEGLDAIKQKRMVPAVATLGDTKYTARDANIVLGLFDPSFFGLTSYLGYKINDSDNTGLKGHGRFLQIIRGRDGEQGSTCPLFFDGATCNFEELPRPDDVNAVSKYYVKAQNMRSYRQTRKIASLNGIVMNILARWIKKK